jgi:uncharacterized iron-regulated protein
LVGLALLIAGAAACGETIGSADNPLRGREHLLVNRIWHPRAGNFIAAKALEEAVRNADLVLLGESHDNPEHHRLQARLVRVMVEAGRRPAVVFEMIRGDRQTDLDRHLASRPRDGAGIGLAVGWKTTGWPPWKLYRPIAEVALKAGLPLVAGDLTTTRLRAVRRVGLYALPPRLRRRLHLDRPLGRETRLAMRRELYEAHCRRIPKSALDRMITVQRARDAVLADNLVRALSRQGVGSAVLIAGTGHVRADRGVPIQVSKLASGKRTVSVGFVEVSADAITPEAYQNRFDRVLPFDFVWFTPRMERRRLCGSIPIRGDARA